MKTANSYQKQNSNYQLPITNFHPGVPMDQAALIQAVVREVLTQLGSSNISPRASAGAFGGFKDVNQAVDAAKRAQGQLALKGITVRDAICRMIKRIAIEN